MTINSWLEYAIEHQENIEYLIANWHPVRPSKPYGDMTITAPNAEIACEAIRESIKKSDTRDPVLRFREALFSKSWQEVNVILNETWFGVPESRDCWQLKGFREVIHLMEELPDIAYEQYNKEFPLNDPRD